MTAILICPASRLDQVNSAIRAALGTQGDAISVPLIFADDTDAAPARYYGCEWRRLSEGDAGTLGTLQDVAVYINAGFDETIVTAGLRRQPDNSPM